MINELEIEVSADHIDELGHVNNARFLEYFERGRIDWYNCGGDFPDPKRRPRLGTVVVNVNVNFRRECFSGWIVRRMQCESSSTANSPSARACSKR